MKALQPVWKQFEKDIGADLIEAAQGRQRRKLILSSLALPRPGRPAGAVPGRGD